MKSRPSAHHTQQPGSASEAVCEAPAAPQSSMLLPMGSEHTSLGVPPVNEPVVRIGFLRGQLSPIQSQALLSISERGRGPQLSSTFILFLLFFFIFNFIILFYFFPLKGRALLTGGLSGTLNKSPPSPGINSLSSCYPVMGLHFLFCKMQVELHQLAACAQGEAVWGRTVMTTNITQDLPHAGAGALQSEL